MTTQSRGPVCGTFANRNNWPNLRPRGSGNKIHIDEAALREDIKYINSAKELLEEAKKLIPDSGALDSTRMLGEGYQALCELLDMLKQENLSKIIPACGDLALYIDEVIKRYQAADSEAAKVMGGGGFRI